MITRDKKLYLYTLNKSLFSHDKIQSIMGQAKQ